MSTEPGRRNRSLSMTVQVGLIVAAATLLAVLAFAAASVVQL